MIRAAIYARSATSDRGKDHLANQIRSCTTYAEHNDMNVVATFSDAPASGVNFRGRPGIDALLRETCEGEFDVVVVESLDRVARSLDLLLEFKAFLEAHGLKLHAVFGEFDGLVLPSIREMRSAVKKMRRRQ